MPTKPIDLQELTRVLGEPPPRYRKGDERNRPRAAWYKRANNALSELLALTPRVNAGNGARKAPTRKLLTPDGLCLHGKPFPCQICGETPTERGSV